MNTKQTKELLYKAFEAGKIYLGGLEFGVYEPNFEDWYNNLALGKQKPLAKNKQTKELKNWCEVCSEEAKININVCQSCFDHTINNF